MAKLPKRTALDSYLHTKEIPPFRSEPFKLVASPIWLESEKEWYVDPYVNANKFKDYNGYLIGYKKTYDLIFSGLTDPIEKAEFKQKICSKLSETAQIPNYPYLELITDLLELINTEYDLYKKGLKTVVSEIPADQSDAKLTIKQIALKLVYQNANVSKDNADGIILGYGHTSGQKLYQLFNFYHSRANRTAHEETKKKIENKIELFESVIDLLEDNFKQKAIDELITLKAYLTKY